MKNYVKRDKFRTYVKSKIEIDNVSEWTYLSSGLRDLLEKTNEDVNFYKNLSDMTESDELMLKEFKEKRELLTKMLIDLDNKNAIEWV